MFNDKGSNIMLMPPEAEAVLAELSQLPDTFLVGGGVRDILLGKNLDDLDIILPDAGYVSQKIADNIPGTIVHLGENSGQVCHRFVFTKQAESLENAGLEIDFALNRLWVDLVEISSGDVWKDLACRDFTINAMALPLTAFISYIKGELSLYNLINVLKDPHGGYKDLKSRVLREVTSHIFKDDPLRLWRLWRIAAELEFKPSESLRRLVLQDAYLSKSVPGERIRNELLSLLDQPQSADQLKKAACLELLEHQFPMLSTLKGCQQGDYHYQDVWEHSFQVIIELEFILSNLHNFFPAKSHREIIEAWLEKDTNRAVLKLTALFHDIGKPLVKETSADGHIRFFNHEKAGLSLVRVIASDLRLSRRERALLLFLVNRHLQIHDVIGLAARRTQDSFWQKYGEDTLGLILLGSADLISKKGSLVKSKNERTYFLNNTPKYIDIWLQKKDKSFKTKPLLDGREIMKNFDLKPGRQVGYLKQTVWEAQLEGKVATQKEALTLIEQLIKEKDAAAYGNGKKKSNSN